MRSDDFEKYMERELVVDCPQMVLRQNTESPDCTYGGPGSIYQTPEGGLMFKLYAGGAPDHATFARIMGHNSAKSGEIIPHHEYFSLEATSLSGALWRGEFILPDFSLGVAHGPVITGSLYELTETTPDPHSKELRPHLSLRFAEDFDFPGNTRKTTKTFMQGIETGMSGDWTSATFDAAGLSFELQRDRRSVLLSAQSKNTDLPQHLDLRICEAREFTLFASERWVIRVVSKNGQTTTTLRPFPTDCIRKTSRPPVGFRSRLTSQFVWSLFAKYLEYVITYPQAEWHPVSERVHLAVAGDANPLDAGMLGLSVAVEGVLNTGFSKLAAPDDSLREQIEAARKLVTDSSLRDSFKQRLSGTFGAMHTPRAKDKLMALVDAGLIRKELMDAWGTIRNSTVHAADLDPTAMAEIYRDYQSALTLFNELVFLVIGYVGQYTDYSVVGWPLRNFDKTMKDLQVSENEGSSGASA
jgi:hypothetical protein